MEDAEPVFDEAEFLDWMKRDLPESETWIVVAREGAEERWSREVLDNDIRAVATEYFRLAHDPSLTLTTITELAGQPPLYAEHVVSSALALLAQYALFAAQHLEVERIFTACKWLVRIARTEGIIPGPAAS